MLASMSITLMNLISFFQFQKGTKKYLCRCEKGIIEIGSAITLANVDYQCALERPQKVGTLFEHV